MSVPLRQKSARRECESKRSRMVAESVIGFDRFGHQVWPLRGDPRIHVLAIIAEGPAIKPALLYRSEVVGHEIAAKFVAGDLKGSGGMPERLTNLPFAL